MAGEWEVAKTTANVPHPYEDGMAEEWISSHQEEFDNGEAVTFAIENKESGALLGAISLHIWRRNNLAEIGYWIGKPYWDQGYCTEAAAALLEYGFSEFDLNRIQARYVVGNPASGRVLEKIGMAHEGIHRQASYRFGSYEGIAMSAILLDEFERKTTE